MTKLANDLDMLTSVAYSVSKALSHFTILSAKMTSRKYLGMYMTLTLSNKTDLLMINGNQSRISEV